MAPTVVLNQSLTAHTNMNTASISNQLASTTTTNLHGFDIYQITTVGASEETIRTLVHIPISAPTYRKALITKTFFRQILNHTISLSVSISDLVSTVAIYFDMSTTMAEKEAEAVAISFRDSIICVDNMVGVEFFDPKEKAVTTDDP